MRDMESYTLPLALRALQGVGGVPWEPSVPVRRLPSCHWLSADLHLHNLIDRLSQGYSR
jgi:hypothetical protein